MLRHGIPLYMRAGVSLGNGGERNHDEGKKNMFRCRTFADIVSGGGRGDLSVSVQEQCTLSL